jgi:type II secretion system protein D
LVALLALFTASVGAGAESIVKVYSCKPGTARATADGLREQFGVFPGVRVAADERTAQVIVHAPPEIQASVSRHLAAASTPGPAKPAAPEISPSASRAVSLTHVTPEQFEASLWGMLGNRLSAVPGQGRQDRRYRLILGSGAFVDMVLQPGARQVIVEGAGPAVESCERLVQVLDNAGDGSGRTARLVSLQTVGAEGVRTAASAVRDATNGRRAGVPMVASLFQAGEPAAPAPKPAEAAPPAPKPPEGATPGPEAKPAEKLPSGLKNPVQIEMLEGLDVLIIKGSTRDVDQVMQIIQQIEKLSAETKPAIQLVMLKHVDCMALTNLVRSLYDEVFLARQGNVSITAIVKPNALLVVGRPENVQTVIDLVRRLDQPVSPNTQFEVFQLQHASPVAVQAAIQQFYVDRGGLGPIVRSTLDVRTNSVIVQASPRDLQEVAELVRRIDVAGSQAVNEMRVVQLEHSLAQELAAVMMSAIGTAIGTGTQGMQQGAQQLPGLQQVPGMQQQLGTTRTGADQRQVMLRFLTIDTKGQRLLRSGILTDVRITPDVRANALLISAPTESMELILALVKQLDQLPAAEAQIKVFTIVNGDALSLADMLRSLFGLQAGGTQGQGGFGQGGFGQLAQQMFQTAAGSGENSLVTLRFAVDSRTNSIIASGAMGDLNVVEAILVRLDDSDVRHRKSVIIRLKNAPANNVATSINQFLQSQQQIQQRAPGLVSPFEQLEQEVVVVPEPVSNSLILSATPRFFEEIKGIIDQLDERPPMVMIQVLIADVQLGNNNEFGLELGLQDGLLFDRSVLSNIQYQTTTQNLPNNTSVTSQTIVAADNNPGFNFNNTLPLGNSGSTNALANAAALGTQGLSSFALGRTNSRLGFGGLVLSAASENISVLLRALNECHRLEILERPQIMTLDNQPAFIQVGQRVPRITASQPNQFGIVNSMTLDNVGLVLGVTPRISPDGLVVMEIDAEKSEVGPEAEGIPISVSQGQTIRSPRINVTTAQTTVSALDGQTVILGGLIAKTKTEFHRKVPLLGDIPLLGRLFRYDGVSNERHELLIIMTPHIVKSEADADKIRRAEAARMSWCLADVVQIYGEAGLRRRTDEWSDAETRTIFPDAKQQPLPPAPQIGRPVGPELLPAPQGVPNGPAKPPLPTPTPAQPGPTLPGLRLPEPSGAAPPVSGTSVPGPPAPMPPSLPATPALGYYAPQAAQPAILAVPMAGPQAQPAQPAHFVAPPNPANYPGGVQSGVQPLVYHQPVAGQPGPVPQLPMQGPAPVPQAAWPQAQPYR